MPQRTLLVLLIAACTLSSGCDTSRRVLGHVLSSRQNRNRTRHPASRPNRSPTTPPSRPPPPVLYPAGRCNPDFPFALEDRPGIHYRVKVLDDPEEINAFAVLGGYLYVYSGLLLIAEDEAEIAGVLAHEIGHIVGRHSANQLAARFGMELLASPRPRRRSFSYSARSPPSSAVLASAATTSAKPIPSASATPLPLGTIHAACCAFLKN